MRQCVHAAGSILLLFVFDVNICYVFCTASHFCVINVYYLLTRLTMLLSQAGCNETWCLCVCVCVCVFVDIICWVDSPVSSPACDWYMENALTNLYFNVANSAVCTSVYYVFNCGLRMRLVLRLELVKLLQSSFVDLIR